MEADLLKDEVLNRLASTCNVAQFVSYAPTGSQRYSQLKAYPSNHLFDSIEEGVRAVLENATDGSANVRSFNPRNSKSREFVYGLKRIDDVAATIRRLNADGSFAIVNETLDIDDGGVSGVAMCGLIEFAPGDTPRCVEKPGVASMNRDMGLQLLERVYGFRPVLDYDPSARVEFSIHPLRRGVRNEHTIIWEIEDAEPVELVALVGWPNRFSRFIGDKAFGLLVADLNGLAVPYTTVIGRHLAPFSYGRHTGTAETWIRTCPTEQLPGRFATSFGWQDPFRLLAAEDPSGDSIASVLAQEGVHACYSGALIATSSGEPIIEGVKGHGTDFMLGRGIASLPPEIRAAVGAVFDHAFAIMGPVRFEWVHDGERVWVVQLHRGETPSSGRIIYPGEAKHYHRFSTADGIEALRELIQRISATSDGITLVGNVGVTSHLGDLLRQARIPSHIEPPSPLDVGLPSPDV